MNTDLNSYVQSALISRLSAADLCSQLWPHVFSLDRIHRIACDKPPSNRLSNRPLRTANEPFNIGLDGNRSIFPFQSRYRSLLRPSCKRQHERVLSVGTQRALVA